jgi:hypothetical protein
MVAVLRDNHILIFDEQAKLLADLLIDNAIYSCRLVGRTLVIGTKDEILIYELSMTRESVDALPDA